MQHNPTSVRQGFSWSINNWPNSQIPACTCSMSHNALIRTEMCTFLFWMEHCGIWNRCILLFEKLVYWCQSFQTSSCNHFLSFTPDLLQLRVPSRMYPLIFYFTMRILYANTYQQANTFNSISIWRSCGRLMPDLYRVERFAMNEACI